MRASSTVSVRAPAAERTTPAAARVTGNPASSTATARADHGGRGRTGPGVRLARGGIFLFRAASGPFLPPSLGHGHRPAPPLGPAGKGGGGRGGQRARQPAGGGRAAGPGARPP